jgi:hypothetical protein
MTKSDGARRLEWGGLRTGGFHRAAARLGAASTAVHDAANQPADELTS